MCRFVVVVIARRTGEVAFVANDDPFVSVVDLSNYIGRDVTTDEGALIAVDAACNLVRTLTGQKFNNVIGDQIVLDGTGTDCLLLPEIPVTAAGTVTVGGAALVQNVDYVLADNRKLIRTAGTSFSTTIYGDLTVWPMGRQNVQVTYDHGYAGGTIPSDVRMVALQVASRIALQGIVASETIAGQSLSYTSPALDLTPGERLILQRHDAY
jgi:hypothetical protein